MPRYKITIVTDGSRIDAVKRQCAEVFGKDVSTQVDKVGKATRAERLADAEGMVSDAREIVVELKEELEEWKGNLPENLQSGSKADELDEAVSQLESIENDLDRIEFGDVSFPSMM